MKKLLLLSVICLIMVVSLFGQGSNVDFIEYDLDNGLHVILHQDNSTPVAAVSVLYHVGSKNENPDKTGFAHFFEHLLFEGSENIGRGEYTKYVENAGGTLNANTSWDRTFYFEILPSNQLEMGLWLESERMLHAVVENVGIETQREVVKEERRMRVDNQPYGSVLEQSMKRAYKEHPYKWPIIGSMAHLEAAVESDYVNFYKTFYVPNNATLSIAGDIDIEQAKMWVDKYFGSIPKGTMDIPRPNVVEPALGGEVRDTVYDNIQLPAVIQTYRIPAQGTPEFYAVDMLGTLLSGGESSRFNKAIKDEQQLAVFIGSFPLPMEDPGVNITYCISNMGVDLTVLEAAMETEVKKVQTELITDREFQKLRNQYENQFASQAESISRVSESLANYHTYLGDANLINTEVDRYLAVTKEDLMKVAKKYFVPSNRVTLLYLPHPTKS